MIEEEIHRLEKLTIPPSEEATEYLEESGQRYAKYRSQSERSLKRRR